MTKRNSCDSIKISTRRGEVLKISRDKYSLIKEDFLEKVRGVVGDEYTFIDEYKNANTKIMMRHNVCGTEELVVPYNFLNKNRRCSMCSNRDRMNDILKDTTNGEYEIVPILYNGINEITEMLHIPCGTMIKESPFKIRHGKAKCFNCYNQWDSKKSVRYTDGEFKKRAFEMVGSEYTFLEEYTKSIQPIEVRHNKCGLVYKVSPNNFFNGKRCPECARYRMSKSKKKTHEQFLKDLNRVHGCSIVVVSEYKPGTKKTGFKCGVCSHEWMAQGSSVLSGKGCPMCGGNMPLSTEEFKNRVYEKVGEEYEVLGEYKNNKTYIKMLHKVCGTEYEATPTSFMDSEKGNCNVCRLKTSRGENIICEILKSESIDFMREYRIDGCMDVRPLPFDFAIFEDGALSGLIEYDGRQHFESIEHFGGEESLLGTIKRDGIKNQYCQENDIPLLRIPYTKCKYSEIENEVINFLKNGGIING